jgi:NAD(P)-dependent dehydrogenase (short-subunit alcohol dehydrogenase family)
VIQTGPAPGSIGDLRPDCLAGEVVVVTGAGQGIGYEAARALLGLGASVIIAELDGEAGARAAQRLASQGYADRLAAVPTDVSDEDSVARLARAAEVQFGRVDAVVNNATVAVVGRPVWETPVEAWDRSYEVNVRGPILLARAFLPGMVARGHGTFVCVSSTGGPYLAAYESAKAAQVTVAASLDAELADTGVVAFTIGPGLVPTATATAAIERLAPLLGTDVESFWQANAGAVLSVEDAGRGFAAAVAMAGRYAGQEISSGQALVDAGVTTPPATVQIASAEVLAGRAEALAACRAVATTLAEQAAGWNERSFFERQWMIREFKRRAGMPVERWLETLAVLERAIGDGTIGSMPAVPLALLSAFYHHLGELARGYVKDPAARAAQLRAVAGWEADVARLAELIGASVATSSPA